MRGMGREGWREGGRAHVGGTRETGREGGRKGAGGGGSEGGVPYLQRP